jgi:RNA polymerase sigma-70 factor (ECF subfamily)
MDRPEFERLALSELDAVYRFARFLTKDAARAEDLVQDVYARALDPKHARNFKDRSDQGCGGIRAWLFAITRSRFYNDIERGLAQRNAFLRHHAQHSRDPAVPLNPPPAAIDWTSAMPQIHEAINGLRLELREVLWLWAMEHMKYKEISLALDVPIGTVMSRLHRARSQVAKAISCRPDVRAQLEVAGYLQIEARTIQKGAIS